MGQTKIPVIEVYITNVCNLTCRGCNRFNNYNFKGHFYWEDYSNEMELWSTKLDPEKIVIMGGEPTLNPDLKNWVHHLRRLWPQTAIGIQSNGTYARPEHHKFWDDYKVGMMVAVHDPATADEIAESRKGRGIIEAFVFHQSAVIDKGTHFEVHQSDPSAAFKSCGMKHSHTLYAGKLFKCPAMANLPAFRKQFPLVLDSRQEKLLGSYTPLSVDCTDEELTNFINTRETPIPQCEFCPSELIWQTALGEHKIITELPKYKEYKIGSGQNQSKTS